MVNSFNKSHKVLKGIESYPIIPFVPPIIPDAAPTNQNCLVDFELVQFLLRSP